MPINEIATVAQRMNNAGPSKGTGITKSSIKQNLFNKPRQQGQARSQQANSIPYRVPGQPAQSSVAPQQGQAPASPLANQLGSPQKGLAKNAIFDPNDYWNQYSYKDVKPDFSSIDPNDPDEIRYQKNIKAQQEAGKNGQPVQAIGYYTKARDEIKAKTAEINRLGREKMNAARMADPRSTKENLEGFYHR